MTRLDEIEAKLVGGEILTYEDAADFFEHTVIGKTLCLPRAQVLAMLRAKYPTPEELTASIREMNAVWHAMKRGSLH